MQFTWKTPFSIFGSFLLLGVVSILVGLCIGLLGSYIFKRIRLLTISPIRETLLIFVFGYLAYSISELLQMSGIISLLTAGISMAHYGWYNLSPQGKHVSSSSFQVIGYGAEAFIFGYLGLTFFTRTNHEWSWEFVVMELFVIVIGRSAGIFGVVYLFVLFGHKKTVSVK